MPIYPSSIIRPSNQYGVRISYRAIGAEHRKLLDNVDSYDALAVFKWLQLPMLYCIY